MKLKNSFYNELIPVEETGEFLLYNTITEGLYVLDQTTGNILKDQQHFHFSLTDFPEVAGELQNLYQAGFLVDHELDEKKHYQEAYYEKQSRKFSNNSHIGLTIGTTILCNMGCPYCFETVKPNKTLRDTKVINALVAYIEDMINNAPVEKWASLSITWYGGEPLINKDAISILSGHFINLADKYNIPYDASIITNGILLDKKAWQLLRNNKVSSVQVTIDGAREVHEAYRPLKNANSGNYEKILEHLTLMPLDMQAAIRINTDRRVAATLERLLDDLEMYGIWPQRHQSVSLSLAWLRPYKGADNSSMLHLTAEEYFDFQNEFSALKVERFNRWAEKNSEETAKIKWKFPEKQSDCATYVSPYFFTFDPEGTIHKCWETVHDTRKSSGATVFQRWNAGDFEKYLNYSRTSVHPVCYNCKFNPVCEGLSCAYDSLGSISEEHFPCTPWKTKLGRYFTDMYLKSLKHPDMVAIQKAKDTSHQTHANK